VRTGKSRKLLRQAEVIAKKQKIPVHTQIRVAHDTSQAILETIKEQHIDILLMGWKGNTITPGRIFGNVVDTLIRQAPCDVVLVKLPEDRQEARGKRREAFSQLPSPTPDSLVRAHSSAPLPTPSFNHWLVPMAGGPNAKAAIKLLPALASLGEEPEIQLCQVFESKEAKPDLSVLQQAIRYLVKYRQLAGKVTAIPVISSSVADGLINLVKTEDFDVIVLGASREGMLQNAIKGNIPAQIANRVDSTVILVRGEIEG
jgi:chloride channel protein, CIC family